MITSSVAHRLALVAAVYVTLVGGSHLHAQEADLSEPVRAALARYADLDPLAIKWSQKTEATQIGRKKITADELGGIIIARSNVQQFAFREGRIYVRRETKGGPSSPPSKVEIAFDRSVFYEGDPRDPPFLQKWLPKNDRPEASYFSDDYFRAAGVRLPTRIKELVLSWHPQSELLALLAEGGRVKATDRANLDGRPLIRVQVTAKDWRLQGIPDDLAGSEESLRSPGVTEEEVQRKLKEARIQERRAPQRLYDFYLDPERGYAVRRLEIRDEANRLVYRSDCTEHEQLTGRVIWMPRLCRVEEYTFEGLRDEESLIPYDFGSPLFVTNFQVSAFDVKPWPYDRFELKYTAPGTQVNDATFPETKGKDGIFYKVPANPQDLDQVIAAHRAKAQARVNAEKRSSTIRMILLILNGVGLPILVFYLIVRWRKKGSNA